MDYTLLVVALVLAVIDWVAVWRKSQTFEFVFKPATLIVLLLWFVQTTGLQGRTVWFAIGLGFSLAGDIFLMLPVNLFMAGLASFLLAHLAYTGGFNPTFPPIDGIAMMLAVVVGGAAFLLYRRVAQAVASRPGGTGLSIGILVYSIALTLMTVSAMLTLVRPEWSLRSASYTAVGGLLFFTSDSVLALDRFADPIPKAKVLVHMTYHLGQIALMLGVASQVVG
ncbi:MAG: lysoplasmalogenase [Anaerolineaceae bacterium]|nr:lysoplasmalogenase [Anaerolineaceae bacterium]